ncbi:MAG TPA: hypothetical protein VFA18_13200 [Gemmataceae bacterium]|nr:hypothetical protein [Gemmataceae bacterium]
MACLVSAFLWSASVVGVIPATYPPGSYLWFSRPGPRGACQTEAVEYVPQPGDLVLFDDHSKTWLFLYHMAGTDMPDHSGFVVALPDGRPAILESAPDDGKLLGLYVELLDALPRLDQFQGTIYIRRVRHPLTPEQSARVTQWALQQQGKRYALFRMLLQGTPFRCRSGLRAKLFARTKLDRSSYFCSEIVVAAGTVAGLFDPRVHQANRIYPRDLLYDDHYDLSATWYPAGVWHPTPPTLPRPAQPAPVAPAPLATSGF